MHPRTLFSPEGDGSGGGGAPPAGTPPQGQGQPQGSWTAGIFDAAQPGQFVADWHAKAPEPAKWEPYKGAKSFEEFATIAEKRVADAQTALRNRTPQGVVKPGENATPEQIADYRKAIGLPEAPEGYNLAKPADLPDELWDAEEASEFSKLALDLELKPEAVAKLAQWQTERAKQRFGSLQQQQASADQALRQSEAVELGKRFGSKLDATIKDLQSVAQTFGVDPGIFDPNGPKFWGVEAADFFSKVLSRIPRGEDSTLRTMAGAQPSGQYDKAWAKAILDPKHPDNAALTNPSHPRHKEIVNLRNQAYALAG